MMRASTRTVVITLEQKTSKDHVGHRISRT